MKFKKMVLTFSVAAAFMSAVTVTSASAMKATYDRANNPGVVTLSDVQVSGDKNTIILFKGSNDDINGITSEIIRYVNQGDSTQSYFTAIPVNTLDDGTYTVKIGSSDMSAKVQVAEFTVGGNPHDVLLGDVDMDGEPTADDAAITLKATVNSSYLSGDKATAADVTKNGSIQEDDALEILRYAVSGKSPSGYVGTTIQVQ